MEHHELPFGKKRKGAIIFENMTVSAGQGAKQVVNSGDYSSGAGGMARVSARGQHEPSLSQRSVLDCDVCVGPSEGLGLHGHDKNAA